MSLDKASAALLAFVIFTVVGFTYNYRTQMLTKSDENLSFFCASRLDEVSILDFFNSETGMKEIEEKFEDLPHFTHPLSMPRDMIFDKVEIVAIKSSIDLTEPLENTTFKGRLDDEMIVILNDEVVYKSFGVKDKMHFEQKVNLKAGENSLLILHNNLGLHGFLEFEHKDAFARPINWSCNEKPGFCVKNIIKKSALHFDVVKEQVRNSPAPGVFHPINVIVEGRDIHYNLRSSFNNTSKKPIPIVYNSLIDDEVLVLLNGELVQQEGSFRAPRGISKKLELKPGNNEVEIFYHNVGGRGDLKLAFNYLDGAPVPFRCQREAH